MTKESVAGGDAVETFDAVEAMNTAGFVEFLAKFKDSETFDTEDKETIKVRFEAFKTKREASSKLSSVFKAELGNQGLDVEFKDAELAPHIGERMEAMAHENPEKVNEIFAAVTEYESLLMQIMAAKKRVTEMAQKGNLETSLEALKEKQRVLETASESNLLTPLFAKYESFAFRVSVDFARDWLAKNTGEPPVSSRAKMEAFVKERGNERRLNDARIAVVRDYAIELSGTAIEAALEKTKKEIEDMSTQIESLNRLEKEFGGAQKRFLEIRELLLAGIGTNDALKEIAKKKVKDRLAVLMNSDPEKAQDLFENVLKVDNNNAFGIDYLDGKQAEMQKEIEKRIDERVSADMKSVVEKTPFGTKAYDKLAKSLEGFLKKNKLGTKEGDEARSFVLDTLKTIAKDIMPKDKARGLLIRFMLARLSGQTA
jgi:hypothetical protein